jgi:hypothetical protein
MKKAQIDSTGLVLNIAVFNDNSVDEGWIEYFDENPAYIGGYYVDKYFYAPQPYPSWFKDGAGNWSPPVPYPTDGKFYTWNEDTASWVKI